MPSTTRLPSTMPIAPLPAGESKPRTGNGSMPRSFAAANDGARPADARSRASTLAANVRISVSEKPSAGTIAVTFGLAFGERAGLVDDQRIDALHALERFGIADQHAGLRAAPDADHDRHRCRKPERAGAGDDQNADGRDQRISEARLRAERRPGRERDQRRRDHRRHEPGRHAVGEALDRRARALRRRDHLHDAREQGVAADLVGAHDEAAALIERAADHRVALRCA